MAQHNVEQYVTLVLAHDNNTEDRISPLSKVIADLGSEELIMTYAIYKCYYLLKSTCLGCIDVDGLQKEAILEHQCIEYASAIMRIGIDDEEQLRELERITAWGSSTLQALVTLAKAVSYRDISIGLQLLGDFIYEQSKSMWGIDDL